MSRRDTAPKTAAFIDGANFYATAKALGFMIDYRKLKAWLTKEYGTLYRVYYYTTLFEGADGEYSSMRPLVDWLDYNGFHVTTKTVKEYADPVTGRRKSKGSMDVDITCDMLQVASYVTNIVLFSGDSSLLRPLRIAMAKGCTATIVSSKETTPSMISDEMRRQADVFLDVMELRPHIEGGDYVARPPLAGVAARVR